MVKQFHILFLLFILASLAPVFASDIQFYEISSEIKPDMGSVNKLSFIMSQNASNLNFEIFAKVTNFNYNSNFEGVKCTTDTNVVGTEVKCSIENNTADNRIIKIVYETVSYTTTENKNGVFSANYKLFSNVDSASIAVKLPEGFVLIQDGKVPAYSPQDGVITSDGRRIITQWFRRDIVANQDLIFSVLYEDRRPEPVADLSRVVVSSFVLIILFGVVMAFVLRGKRKEQTETILEVLTADEKQIINIIKENGGSVIQKKIVDSTDYSKAKVSRILKDLQLRGIVTLEPHGRENMVHLTKKIKK